MREGGALVQRGFHLMISAPVKTTRNPLWNQDSRPIFSALWDASEKEIE